MTKIPGDLYFELKFLSIQHVVVYIFAVKQFAVVYRN